MIGPHISIYGVKCSFIVVIVVSMPQCDYSSHQATTARADLVARYVWKDKYGKISTEREVFKDKYGKISIER